MEELSVERVVGCESPRTRPKQIAKSEHRCEATSIIGTLFSIFEGNLPGPTRPPLTPNRLPRSDQLILSCATDATPFLRPIRPLLLQ